MPDQELIKQGKVVSWSMDKQQNLHIAELLENSDAFFVSGEYDKEFDFLNCVKKSILQSINEGEEKELIDVEKNIDYSIAAFRFSKGDDWKLKTMTISRDKVEHFIRIYAHKIKEHNYEYRKLLMLLLDKYGYLRKKLKDSHKLGM